MDKYAHCVLKRELDGLLMMLLPIKGDWVRGGGQDPHPLDPPLHYKRHNKRHFKPFQFP